MGKINEFCAGMDVGKRFLVLCLDRRCTGGAAKPDAAIRCNGSGLSASPGLAEFDEHHARGDGKHWLILGSDFQHIGRSFHHRAGQPGRSQESQGAKTDRKDAEHLADLLRHDHIRASYIPPKPIRDLRDLTRRRLQLTQDASRERNRIEKLLEHVNIKIGNVLSDVFGVSGKSMLLALLDGNLSPNRSLDWH